VDALPEHPEIPSLIGEDDRKEQNATTVITFRVYEGLAVLATVRL